MADLTVVLVLTATLFLVAIAAMAIGVIMRRPCLRGVWSAEPTGIPRAASAKAL